MSVQLRFIILLGFISTNFTLSLYPDTVASLRRPTAVIGFQSNLTNDPAAGNWFTRVLIRELQKIPAIRTPSADAVLKKIRSLGLMSDQVQSLTNAAKITADLNCVQFVIGSIEPDANENKVKVKFALYNAQTLELEAEDGVTVKGGLGLYDALDDFQKEITHLLFDNETLSAKLGLSISAGSAFAFVNGGNYGEVQKGLYRWVRIKPKRYAKVEFKDKLSGMNMYSTNVMLAPDTEKKLIYVPSANLVIEGLPGAKIYKSDGTVIGIFTNGILRTELNSLITDSLTINTRNMKYLLEMETRVNSEVHLKAIKLQDPREINYLPTIPFLNLAIPGFAQFQANDVFLGILFSGLATSGIGLTFFGFFANGQMDIKSQVTVIPEDIRKFQTYGELYRTIGSIGAGLWALSALISCAYAYWHPSRFIDPTLPESPISLNIKPDSMGLEFNFII